MQQISLIPSFEKVELHSSDLVAKDVISSVSQEIQQIKTLANPLTCDSKYLPFLAHAFKVDFWDENLDESDKRNLIQSSILLHQRKGTVWAIEKVFEALNIKAIIKEWFSYAGLPYHFKVDLSLEDKEITPAMINDLTKYIGIYKNVRSVLDELILSYVTKHNLYVSSSNMGEAKVDAEMVDGYTSIANGNTTIAVCTAFESFCETKFSLNIAYIPKKTIEDDEDEELIDESNSVGYMEVLSGLTQFKSGAMGHLTSIAIQI